MKKTDGKIIIAIAVALVGILIGAVVLIMIQRDTTSATEPAAESVNSVSESYTEIESVSDDTQPESTDDDESTDISDSPEYVTLDKAIIGEWMPESAYKTTTGDPIDLTLLYGQGYKTYGGTLEFREDNTFSINIGVTNNGSSNNGIYKCEENMIYVTYYSDKSAEFIPEIESDGTISKLLVPQYEYTVVFVRK